MRNGEIILIRLGRRIYERFGEIEGDRIDIRPEIQGDRTTKIGITSQTKSDSFTLTYLLTTVAHSLCFSFLSLLVCHTSHPNSLQHCSLCNTATPSAYRRTSKRVYYTQIIIPTIITINNSIKKINFFSIYLILPPILYCTKENWIDIN